MAGRSLDDYYAGTLSGVAHFDGKSWSPTPYTGNVEAMVFAGEDLFILHDGKFK